MEQMMSRMMEMISECKQALEELKDIIGLALPPEHGQHAIGDQESADDVHRGQCDRAAAEILGQFGLAAARGHDGADDRDARNRVRAGHQRRVQGRRNLGDDLESNEYRQYEDSDRD